MTDHENILLDWRICHYLRCPICLSFGQARVTDNAFSWRPQYAASVFAKWLFRGAGVSISREDISTAQRTTFGLNKNMLSITTKAGKRYRFQVDDVGLWLEALNALKEIGS